MPIAAQLTPAVTAPPAAFAATVAPMMPLPMASTMRPSTSSITAPAMIDTPSSESIFLRSERMRAVMPTEVAVDMMPMYMGGASMQAWMNGIWARWPNLTAKNFGSSTTAQRSPNRNEPITPPMPR